MMSIYQRALGAEFSKLHPRIQQRFSLTSESGVAAIGTGVMDSVWHRSALHAAVSLCRNLAEHHVSGAGQQRNHSVDPELPPIVVIPWAVKP